MTATTPYDVMLFCGALPFVGFVGIYIVHELDARWHLIVTGSAALWCCIYVGALYLLS